MRAGAGRHRPGATRNVLGPGALPDPGKGAAPGPAAPGQSCGNPAGIDRPGGDTTARRSPGGQGGRWHRDATPAPGTAPLSAGAEAPVPPEAQPGTCEDRAPRRGRGLLAPGYHPTRAAAPPSGRGCGARGAPGAAAGGPELPARTAGAARGSHRDGPGPAPPVRGRRLPLRHGHACASRSGSRGHACAPREPLHEHGAARTALPERPRGRARLPAPGGESAATCPGPGPLPPPPAVPGRAPHGRGDPPGSAAGASREGSGPTGRAGGGRRRPPGPARRGAAWSPPERPSRRASSGRTLPPTPLPPGRGSRTCPAGCAAPRQPRGAVLSHAWGGSGAARAPLPAPPCPAPARPLPASLPGRAAPIPRPRR
uniref:basic proline-rich protein-like n=1 Tax=Agelaius phoeniceus TaxID=39638 RepID=UPI0023ECAEA7|nr:basic proline-rich protein-like [Agelaius phoeniceus]